MHKLMSNNRPKIKRTGGERHMVGRRFAKKRIKQAPPTSAFKGLTSSQLRKLQKEN